MKMDPMDFNIDKYFPQLQKIEGNSDRISFEEMRALYLDASRHFLEEYREEIKREHRQGKGGDLVVAAITAMMDTLIVKLFNTSLSHQKKQLAPDRQLALVAVGGYGRGELNPFSDIDLMFLHNEKNPQLIDNVAKQLLYLLWDMRIDVGYSVRNLEDCVEMAESDSTVKTAMLDARFLSGSDTLFKDFRKVMLTQILSKRSDAFIREKLVEARKRKEKYGSSVYILEPNIKEGEGCLRDLHTALWVAKIKFKVNEPKELIIKGVLTEEELSLYLSSLEYLWRIRNELHFQAGRKNDQITFDAQANLAGFFGYSDQGDELAVEKFMRDFYLHATRVEHFSSQVINKCIRRDEGALKILGYFTRRPVGEGIFVLKGELVVVDDAIFAKDPEKMIKVFELAQKHGVTININVKALIRNNLELINDKFRRSREVNNSFFTILRADKGVAETLQLMHHLGFLNRFIPEFEKIFCKVQHDIYHIYTVDAHSLFAVEEIIKLWKGIHKDHLVLLTRLAEEVDKRELLLLAVLLHDVGKGAGGRHAEKGADMARTVARRMGLSKEDSECLDFLIRNHLLFAHIAQRRDLHDEKMIIEFARQMGKSGNLKLLYLLTYADIKAVGPDVWTEWKALLLQELYEKAFKVIERGDFSLEGSSERVKKVKRVVFDLLSGDYPPALIKDELKALTTRHILTNNTMRLAENTRILLKLEDEHLVISVAHELEGGYSNCTICTYDVPGLFSMITGVMAANGMNILGAQIHTSTNGKVLDVLQVNSPQGGTITDDRKWQKMEADLRQVLEGKIQVSALVAKRYRPGILVEKPKPKFASRVEIDNDVSAEYTVIDVYTHDKVGLLYQITSTLTKLGLYIGVSKISTKVDQVADVFYVKDIFGHKISVQEKLEEIKIQLLHALEE
jgi:[protein-PII] uridylyltransferase